MTKIQVRFRVVDKVDLGKLNYFVMKTLLASVILIAGLTVAGGQIHKPGLKVGDKAPDFSLPNPDGKSISLADYTKHGPVVVIFYRGYW